MCAAPAASGLGPLSRDQFLVHWQSLPRTGETPDLAAFLDRSNPLFAPWTLIVDLGPGDALPIRLMGTRLVDIFGEYTGKDFLRIMPTALSSVVRQAHQKICAVPCGWSTESRVVTSSGREVVVHLISLPLRNKSASSVVKLVSVVERLNYHEAFVKVLDLRTSQWVDLGAGIP